MVRIGDDRYFQIEAGGTPDTQNASFWNGAIKWVTLVDLPASDLVTEIYDTKRKITEAGLKNSSAKLLPIDTVLISSRATIGRIAINKVELATNQGFKNIVIKDFTAVNPQYVAYILTGLVEQMTILASGGTFKEISKTNISQLRIPLPPLKIQKQIVAQIEEEQKLVEANKKLIEIFEEKIKAKIAEVWGEEAPSETGGEILLAAEEPVTYGQ
jgi:type I restriction enzyme M protein